MPIGANVGRTVRAAGLAGGIGVAIPVLTWASVAPLRALLSGGALDYDTALGGCAAAVAWLTLLWFAGCAALALLSRLPGAVGRHAAGVAQRLTPAVFRRVLEASLGATLVLATSAQVADAASAAPPTAAASLLADPKPPSPDRPDVRPRHHPEPHLVRVRPGDSLWRIARTRMPGRPSDTAVTREWHRWYAANRSLVGGDPDHIVPGQRLRPPAK